MIDKIDEELGNAVYRHICTDDVSGARQMLLEHPELVRGCYRGTTWLHRAAGRSSVAMVRMLLDVGCDANAPDESHPKHYPIDSAIRHEVIPILRLLLEKGASPDPADDRPLIGAITGDKQHSLEMVKLLEEFGADLHKVYTNEYTGEPMNALSTAIDWGKEDVAEYLRSRGAALPEPTKPSRPPRNQAEEIIAYFQEQFGPVRKQSLMEIVPSSMPAIAIHVIPADAKRPHLTLFTTGMSERAMKVPKGSEEYRHAEVFIQLPGTWPLAMDALSDPNYGWPFHWLRWAAQYPHQHQAWLGGPVTILANNDPPEPLAPNLKFTSLLLLVERDMVTRKRWLARGGRKIVFYRLVPLYTEERDLEMREGVAALLRALDRASVPFVVDLNRVNVAKS